MQIRLSALGDDELSDGDSGGLQLGSCSGGEAKAPGAVSGNTVLCPDPSAPQRDPKPTRFPVAQKLHLPLREESTEITGCCLPASSS